MCVLIFFVRLFNISLLLFDCFVPVSFFQKINLFVICFKSISLIPFPIYHISFCMFHLLRNGVCEQQNLTITDGDDVQTLTCADNSFQGILVKESTTNHITLQLLNSEQRDGGRFWLGFRGISRLCFALLFQMI